MGLNLHGYLINVFIVLPVHNPWHICSRCLLQDIWQWTQSRCYVFLDLFPKLISARTNALLQYSLPCQPTWKTPLDAEINSYHLMQIHWVPLKKSLFFVFCLFVKSVSFLPVYTLMILSLAWSLAFLCLRTEIWIQMYFKTGSKHFSFWECIIALHISDSLTISSSGCVCSKQKKLFIYINNFLSEGGSFHGVLCCLVQTSLS